MYKNNLYKMSQPQKIDPNIEGKEVKEVKEVKPKKTRQDYNRSYYEKTREQQLVKARERYQDIKDVKNKKKKERYHDNIEASRAYYREYTRARRAKLKAEQEIPQKIGNNKATDIVIGNE